MIPTDKIATLRPIIVTGVFVAAVAPSSVLLRLFAIEWPLSWLVSNLAGIGSLAFAALWTWSVSSLVMSRMETDAAARATTAAYLRRALAYGVFCFATICVFPFAFASLGWAVIAVGALANLVAAYYWLRSLWRISKRFPASDSTFTTFLQIFYFPVGVWFLYPRLKAPRAAPPLAP